VVPVFVATTMNLDHFPRVLEMLAQLGIKKSIFNRFIPTGLGNLFKNEIGVPNDVRLAEIISEADETAHRCGVEVQLGTPVEVSTSVSANWRNVKLASCPIEVGQRRWALSSDLNLRRCNQSGTHVGSVFGTGLETVLAESKQKERGDSKAIRGCAHLKTDSLVQLRPISKR
jgi:MoaA/NifB/PqqE/SkfB family radical SAM enzyme